MAFGDVIGWVNTELTKSAAEIGYARFLYAVRSNEVAYGQRLDIMAMKGMVVKAWLMFLAISFATGATAGEALPPSLFIVHFETGPNWNESLAPKDQPSFREHSANLSRLRDEGIIVFGARYDDFGIVFLSVENLDEAKSLMEADPGVRSGIFSYRAAPLRVFYPWRK